MKLAIMLNSSSPPLRTLSSLMYTYLTDQKEFWQSKTGDWNALVFLYPNEKWAINKVWFVQIIELKFSGIASLIVFALALYVNWEVQKVIDYEMMIQLKESEFRDESNERSIFNHYNIKTSTASSLSLTTQRASTWFPHRLHDNTTRIIQTNVASSHY